MAVFVMAVAGAVTSCWPKSNSETALTYPAPPLTTTVTDLGHDHGQSPQCVVAGRGEEWGEGEARDKSRLSVEYVR